MNSNVLYWIYYTSNLMLLFILITYYELKTDILREDDYKRQGVKVELGLLSFPK